MKTKKKIILIILICTCVVILIVLSNMLKKEKNKFHTTTLKEYTRTDRYLKLSGFGIFFEKYDGELRASDVSGKLEEVTNKYLPDIYAKVKDLNENQLEEYFDSNTVKISSIFGIEEFSDFNHLISGIKESGIDIEQWDSLSIIAESFTNDSDISNYAYVEYEVLHTDGQKLRYLVYVSKFSAEKPLYIINIK